MAKLGPPVAAKPTNVDIKSLTAKARQDALGMVSHKMSLITIFGYMHKIKNFIKKI